MAALRHRKHEDYLSEMDIDELLSKLTAEDIVALGMEADPDDPFLPPSARCPDQTSKTPTGPLNRRSLVQYLEEKAKSEKDWEGVVYVKKEPLRRWVPKLLDKMAESDQHAMTGMSGSDFDEVVNQATENDLVDLAAILGFHGIITNEQYNTALASDKGGASGGFNAISKATAYAAKADEPPNATDVNESIKSISANDAKTNDINLNNIKLSYDEFEQIFDGLRANTKLAKLDMAATGFTDLPAQWLVDTLPDNKGLTCLNLESNFISPMRVVDLVNAALKNPTITEIKLANQSFTTLGVRAEQAIADLVDKNTRLLKLGLSIDSAGARNRIERALERNMDLLRQNRSK